MSKCELCRSNVKVVGNVTKHYEPMPIDWDKVKEKYKGPAMYAESWGKIIELVEEQLAGSDESKS